MRRTRARDMMILSGDQLYQMDYRQMMKTHRDSGADATVAVIPVAEDQTSAFGILKMDETGRIVHFDEKPPASRLPSLASKLPGGESGYLASMGIYIFKREVLERALANPQLVDFGRHVIPDAVPRSRVQAHVYRGLLGGRQGRIRLILPGQPRCAARPSRRCPISTTPRTRSTRTRGSLPASKVEGCDIASALICEGCIMHGAKIERAVVGIRSRVGVGTSIKNSLLIGADHYETLAEMNASIARGVPPLGIGSESVIENAIIDKNARIGRGVRLVNEKGIKEKDGDGYFIREGLIIVPKNGIVADGVVV